MSTVSAAPPDLGGRIDAYHQDALETLWQRLYLKRVRHALRKHYYDGEQIFKNMGIAIPPVLANFGVVLGWPAKGVDALAHRIKMEDFVLPEGEIEDFGIDIIATDNRLDIEAPQAVTSALIHATAFISTTLGDLEAGEPEVLIQTHSAENATGLWKPTSRSLGAALLVIDEDDNGVLKFYLMFPDKIYAVWRDADRPFASPRDWNVRAFRNPLGRVPVENHPFRPRLGRPFGSSRITRAAMFHTDSALRTTLRAEVGAEFYSAPQRYLLGADESAFVGPNGERKTTWDLLMGRILAIPADEETGETPSVGQFAQISMQPHNEQMRLWAQLFAADQSLPVSALGIVQDNPASAEAIYAAKEDLVIEAENAAAGFEPAWVRAMQTGVQMRDNLREIPKELRSLAIRWRDPSTPSRAAAVDATLKLTSGDNPIIPADSEVALEMAGLSPQQIRRVIAERRRANGRATIAALAALQGAQTPAAAPETPAATEEV